MRFRSRDIGGLARTVRLRHSRSTHRRKWSAHEDSSGCFGKSAEHPKPLRCPSFAALIAVGQAVTLIAPRAYEFECGPEKSVA